MKTTNNLTNAQAIDIMLGLADPVSYIAIKSAKKLLSNNPAGGEPRYMYHWTTLENYQKIRTQGLLTNQASLFLKSGHAAMRRIYGCIPICLSVKRAGEYDIGHTSNGTLLRVDVTGLKLYADIFSLVDHGAYLEENSLWFSRKPRGLGKILDEDNAISYEDLLNNEYGSTDACIKLTGTACLIDNILPDRINVLEVRV